MTKHDTDRQGDSRRLIEDFDLNHDAEYFSNDENRLDFLRNLTFTDFRMLAEHVNARMRGHEPYNKETKGERGGMLPMLATPAAEEKDEAFEKGYHEITEYLETSDESTAAKLRSAGMATEALFIWVHPFNDGNGRTSRFFGKFIEDGTEDVDALVAETVDKNSRLRMYKASIRVDTGNTLKGLDVMLDDDEIEALKQTEMHIPDGIALSIKRLLEDKAIQSEVIGYQKSLTTRYRKALADKALKVA